MDRPGGLSYLDGEDFDCPPKAGRRVASLRGGVFVAYVPREVQVGDGLGDEPVIQFLRLVDFLAPRIAAGVEVPDPLYMVADVAHDIAIHDLGVIDIVEDLDARRVDTPHDVDAPGDVVEHVVLVVDLAVEVLHADGDALDLGVGLNLVQKGHAVGGAFGIGHAFAIAAEGDDVGHPVGRGLIDGGMHQRFQLFVEVLAIERVRNGAAGSRRIHGRSQAVLLEDRPVGRSLQVIADDAERGGKLAAIFQAGPAGKHPAGYALFQTPLLDGWRGCLR